MGIFTNFMINGFSNEREKALYSPGTLFEIMSRIGESLSSDEMKAKVSTLLNSWCSPADTFINHDMNVPVYALEIHAVNEKNSLLNGYGTYVYVPDERRKMVTVPISSIFSKPSELYDSEDPLKVLSSLYSQSDYSDWDALSPQCDNHPVVYELSCSQDDFYPINTWSKKQANDPLEEIFGIFDELHAGEYAGISLVLVPPYRDWGTRGKMRIRSIEDPEYHESIGLFESIRRFLDNEKMPDEEVNRLAGYHKQQLDEHEKKEIEVIQRKISSDAFRCTLRVYASSEDIADDLSGVIIQKADGRYNSLEIINRNASLLDASLRKEGSRSFMLDSDEISSLWHVPAANTRGEKLHKPLPEALTPPENLLSIDIGDPGDIQKLIYSIED